MTGADQKDVAGSDADVLLLLGRLEVLAEHVIPWLEPGNASPARHVEQHAAADETVLEDVDRAGVRALRGDRRVGFSVVEEAVEGDVAEGIDVAVSLVVVVDADVVLGEADAS